MALHFQWILRCLNDGTSYRLTKDPANWADCTYRLERHATYKGIFNQFTSALKFHNDGGGKQFVDKVYQTYDIDGNIEVEVKIDTTGTGTNYEILFTGKLNLASYTTDGTLTTVNIEANDIIKKLNTRADIPVPVNVLSVKAGYYNNGAWVAYSFQGVQLAIYEASDSSGDIIVPPGLIINGDTYYAQTLDANSNPLTAKVLFNGTNINTTPQTDSNISIYFAVSEGELHIHYTGSLNTPIILFRQGQQLSLGQQNISPIAAKNLIMPGIPLQYQSTFALAPVTQSGQIEFDGDAGHDGQTYSFTDGDLLSVTTQDSSGYLIYDQVTFKTANLNPTIKGPGMVSTDGQTNIKMEVTSNKKITVIFYNSYGPIDLWKGSLGSLQDSSSPDTGTPPGMPVDTIQPVSDASTQSFSLHDDPLVPKTYASCLCFSANTIFDNLNDFVWGANISTTGYLQGIQSLNEVFQLSSVPPICTGINAQYIQYPVKVEYSIDLECKITENIHTTAGDSVPLLSSVRFILAYGGRQAVGHVQPLAVSNYQVLKLLKRFDVHTGDSTFMFINPDDNTTSIKVQAADSFTLQPGDQVWFFAETQQIWSEEDTLHPHKPQLKIDLDFTFTKSKIEFKVTENAPPTAAETIMVHEAFNQVVDMIADSDGNFYSEFYGRTNSQKQTYKQNGDGSLRALTNGLCIRGHLDKPIMLSLKDTFNSLSAIDNIGLTVDANNKVRVEKLEYFFNPDLQIAELPFVNTFETTNENSYYLNQIEVGYDKYETELYFKNGLNEIHAKRNYGTKIGSAKGTILQTYDNNTGGFLKVANKLSAISKFIAGNYTIELTRRKNQQWSQDDFKYDNDNFILCLNSTITAPVLFGPNSYKYNILLQTLYISIAANQILIPKLINVSAGDTITITGTTSNGNAANPHTGTIFNVQQYPALNLTVLTFNDTSFVQENADKALISFSNNVFLEFAESILQDPIANVIDKDLSKNWLNMSITPARMLQANMNRITAGLQKNKRQHTIFRRHR